MVREGDILECPCCCCIITRDESCVCDEGHRFCRACVLRAAQIAAGQCRGEIRCLGSYSCTAVIPEVELQGILPERLLEQLEEIRQIKAMYARFGDGVRRCGNCNEVFGVEEGYEDGAECPQCGVVVGSRGAGGRRRRSVGVMWALRRKMRRELRESEEEREWMGDHFMLCGRCQAPTYKIEGCNHMSCPRCEADWCYLCGGVFSTTEEHYDRPGAGCYGKQFASGADESEGEGENDEGYEDADE